MQATKTAVAESGAAEPDQKPVDYDSWYSAGVSFVFHFCLFMLLPLLAALLEPEPRLPPEVVPFQVIDTDATAMDATEGLAGSEAAVESLEHLDSLEFQDIPMEEIADVQPVDIPDVDYQIDDTQQLQDLTIAAAQAAATAKATAQRARETLNRNLGGTSRGTESGGGGTGRAGRAARWILMFNYSDVDQYLGQLGGLGAEIAFPQRGDQWLYFSNLARNPTRVVRDLSGEDRIFWVNEDRASASMIAQSLGIQPVTPMLAFLPVELEQRMLKMELAYKGARSEEDIIQTVFECVRRGGGHDVVVIDQKP
jgi:hypothetical protein